MKYSGLFFCGVFATAIGWGSAGFAAENLGPALSADEIVNTGMQVLRTIDENRGLELWEQASAVVKTQKPRQEFAADIQRARASVGAVERREWAGIMRIRYLAGSVTPPPGLYANLDVATHLKDGRTVFEKISLRWEGDRWLYTGYEPRQQQ